MKNSFSLIVFFLFLLSCSISRNNDKLNNKVIVKLLNTEINIPEHDQVRCIDTIFFEIQNHSQFDYYLATPDSSFIFYSGNDDFGEDYGRIECAGIEFFDEDSLLLTVNASYGFSPDIDHRPTLFRRDIIEIPAFSTKKVKLFLKFPNCVADMEPLYQFVHRLKYTKNVNIIFKPNVDLTKLYLRENKIVLKKNQKILKTYFEFQRPVNIKCRWDGSGSVFRDRKSSLSYKRWSDFVQSIKKGDINYLVSRSKDSIDIIIKNYEVPETDIFKKALEQKKMITIVDTMRSFTVQDDSLQLLPIFEVTRKLKISAASLFTDFTLDFVLNDIDYYTSHGSATDENGRNFDYQKIYYVFKDKDIIYTFENIGEKSLLRKMKIIGRRYFVK